MEQKRLITLLSPLELAGGRGSRNRIVMPPMVIWRGDRSGTVRDTHLRHYAESVRGTGITIVEATAVSPEGRLAATQLGLFDDSQIPGFGDLVRALKREGTLAGIQLHHAGGRTDTEKTYGLTPLVPSILDGQNAVELTDEEIDRILNDFVAAARRAGEAGFELIELHGAHGYLGSQFLSPRTNRRTDRWGGSFENRIRFLRELVRRVREAVGDQLLLSVRLGVAEAGDEGLDIEEGVRAAKELEEEGLDLIHVSHAGSVPGPLESDSPFSPLLQLAKPVKEIVSIPVIAIGGIIEAQMAERALTEGYGDLIASGRAILADPGYARKIVEDKLDQIITCKKCEPRCFHHTNPKLCPTRQRLGIEPPGM